MDTLALLERGGPIAYRWGYCSPDDLYGVALGAYDQFGFNPEIDDLNLQVGYQLLHWRDVRVGGIFREKHFVDVILLMNLVTGDCVFAVIAETQELANKWLKITRGYLDLPRDLNEIKAAMVDLFARVRAFRGLEALFVPR